MIRSRPWLTMSRMHQNLVVNRRRFNKHQVAAVHLLTGQRLIALLLTIAVLQRIVQQLDSNNITKSTQI